MFLASTLTHSVSEVGALILWILLLLPLPQSDHSIKRVIVNRVNNLMRDQNNRREGVFITFPKFDFLTNHKNSQIDLIRVQTPGSLNYNEIIGPPVQITVMHSILIPSNIILMG